MPTNERCWRATSNGSCDGRAEISPSLAPSWPHDVWPRRAGHARRHPHRHRRRHGRCASDLPDRRHGDPAPVGDRTGHRRSGPGVRRVHRCGGVVRSGRSTDRAGGPGGVPAGRLCAARRRAPRDVPGGKRSRAADPGRGFGNRHLVDPHHVQRAGGASHPDRASRLGVRRSQLRDPGCRPAVRSRRPRRRSDRRLAVGVRDRRWAQRRGPRRAATIYPPGGTTRQVDMPLLPLLGLAVAAALASAAAASLGAREAPGSSSPPAASPAWQAGSGWDGGPTDDPGVSSTW